MSFNQSSTERGLDVRRHSEFERAVSKVESFLPSIEKASLPVVQFTSHNESSRKKTPEEKAKAEEAKATDREYLTVGLAVAGAFAALLAILIFGGLTKLGGAYLLWFIGSVFVIWAVTSIVLDKLYKGLNNPKQAK